MRRSARRGGGGWSCSCSSRGSRTTGKWVRRYRAEGETGLLDRSSAPGGSPTPPARADRCDRGPASVAADRPGGRRGAGDGHLDRLGGLEADRPGATPPTHGRGADPPRQASPCRLAAPHRGEEARPHRTAWGWSPCPRRAWAGEGRTRTDAEGVRRLRTGWERVHACVDERHPPGIRRGPRRREGDHGDRLPAPDLAFHRSDGITVERVMTDNGSAYISTAHALAAARSGYCISAPGPGDRRPTARQRDSSARCCASGRTQPSTAARRRGRRPLRLTRALRLPRTIRRPRPPIERLRELPGEQRDLHLYLVNDGRSTAPTGPQAPSFRIGSRMSVLGAAARAGTPHRPRGDAMRASDSCRP